MSSSTNTTDTTTSLSSGTVWECRRCTVVNDDSGVLSCFCCGERKQRVISQEKTPKPITKPCRKRKKNNKKSKKTPQQRKKSKVNYIFMILLQNIHTTHIHTHILHTQAARNTPPVAPTSSVIKRPCRKLFQTLTPTFKYGQYNMEHVREGLRALIHGKSKRSAQELCGVPANTIGRHFQQLTGQKANVKRPLTQTQRKDAIAKVVYICVDIQMCKV